MPFTPVEEISSKIRKSFPYPHIDPGFVNQRASISFLPPKIKDLYYQKTKISGNKDHMERLRNTHFLVDLALTVCEKNNVKSLSEVIQNPAVGQYFCSTEEISPIGSDVYEPNKNVSGNIIFPFDSTVSVEIQFHTNNIVADTGKLELSDSPHPLAVIGQVYKVDSNKLVVRPLIMGAPSYDHPKNSSLDDIYDELVWSGWDAYELSPEDVDEFTLLKESTNPEKGEWMEYMKSTPEREIKTKLADILGVSAGKDWPGELHDLYSSSVHIDGKDYTAAFLLKGPARFEEMKITHLGKNGDQIYRLAQSPASILFVQHSHDISEPVRSTLKRFAVTPSNPRHFCLIDGRATYKLLKAYGKL